MTYLHRYQIIHTYIYVYIYIHIYIYILFIGVSLCIVYIQNMLQHKIQHLKRPSCLGCTMHCVSAQAQIGPQEQTSVYVGSKDLIEFHGTIWVWINLFIYIYIYIQNLKNHFLLVDVRLRIIDDFWYRNFEPCIFYPRFTRIKA